MRFGRGSRYASFPVQLVCLVGLISLQALGTPLQPTLSSCIGSYDAASTEVRLNVTSAYANIVNGEEASRQGLIGGGNDVLRVDLVGLVGQEIAGYDNETNKLATLFSDTTTAHLSVYSSTTWLCNSIFPSELPYPYYPFNTTYCPLQPGDFALNLSIPLYRSYALTTLRTRVRIVDTSLEARTLACYDLEFTPYKDDGWYYRLFLWLPVTLAIGFWITTWAARFAAGWVVGSGVAEYGTKEGIHGSRANIAPGAKREARMRKWGTMIVSGLSGERLSVSGGLLRFVTPGLRDIIQHIQFCTMLGMIAVSWPTFTYPILAKGAWSDLVWNVTLIQGSDPTSKRVSVYPNNYTAPAQFSNMINDAYYPLYLNQNAFNPLIDLHGASDGMESFARAVGLRKQDLFGTCLVVFLLITLAVIILSLFLWTVHGIMEYVSPPVSKRPAAVSQRSSMLYGSSQASLGMKDAYEPKRHSWGAGPSDGPGTLPTQASLNAGMASRRAVSKTRKTWLRFRPKGEAGAFHAAALYGNLLRLILMFHLPITTFSIYQLTLSSATIVSRVFAALAFVFISVLIPAGVLFKVNKTPSGKLYDATRTLLSLGPMYNVYVVQKQMYRVFPLAASLITGIVVGAEQKNGLAQAVILILVELTMLIVLAVWYPWGDGAGMGAPGAFLGMIRVCSAVLVMLLAPQLGMVHSTNAWIAYAVLLLQAIAFVFFLFMLLTKIIEGLIRLFGGAHFDESTSPLDGGIFAAIMDLDCLNGVRGGKAAQRKRRKRGSRQLQRNVSAVGSLTTQMMLDRHSQGVQRQPISQSTTPHLTPYSAYQVNEHGVTNQSDGYFAGYNQPPLGPAPLERHSSDSRSDEPSHSGHIMDAWKAPSGSKAYAAPGLYVPSAQSPSAEAGPSRSFSVIRGGRAEYKNPYEMNDEVAGRSLSPPPGTRVAPATKPVHNRQQSSHGIIEGESPPIIYTDSSPPATVPTLYPPGHTGPRPNNQGLRPPALAIPKRRSLNNLKDDASPDSLNSSSAAEAVKGKKGKRRSKPSTWFAKHNNDSASIPVEDDYTDETDDEPGPSRKRKAGSRPHRPPKPFEPVPSPLLEDERAGGIRGLLGLKRKKSLNDVEERARDENKARKAALAAQSGSLFAGVDAPVSPTAGRGFVVNRKKADSTTLTGTDIKGTRGNPIIQPMPVESPATSQTPDEGSRSFKVKRMGRQTPSPTLAPISVPAPTALIPGSSSSANSHSQSGHSSLIATPEPSPKPGAGFSHTASGAKSTLSAGTYPMTALKSTGTVPLSTGEDNKPPTRTFRVLGRQGGSPTTSTQSLGPVRPTNSRNASSSSFVVNRSQRSSMDTPPLPTTGYAPSDFVPIHSGRRGQRDNGQFSYE